ncbi:MAG: hypothetical protein AAF264_03955 [Pseudomonadota bacterium]
MSGLRNRGIEVVVDTMRVAELDIALHGVEEADFEGIVTNLVSVPVSPRDAGVGTFQPRRVGRWDVAFTTTRDGSLQVITIGAIEPAMQRDKLERRLRQIALLATFRGATGL